MFINELRAKLSDGPLKESIVTALKLIKEAEVNSSHIRDWT